MLIRTKLLAIALLPVVFLLTAATLQYRGSRAVETVNRKALLADDLARNLATLSTLTLEHRLYYEERAHVQWLQQYTEIGRHLTEFTGIFTQPDEQAILAELSQRHQTIGYLFEQY